MKIRMHKEEVIALVKDHFPIPSGFRMGSTEWGTYNDYLEIELDVIPERRSLDRPIFPPQRPCVPDSPGGDGQFAGVGHDAGEVPL